MLDVGCSGLASSRPRLVCPPANGSRIQTALPPGSPALAGAVVQPPGANERLAAQTPALGRPHRFRPRRPFQGNRPAPGLPDRHLLRPAARRVPQACLRAPRSLQSEARLAQLPGPVPCHRRRLCGPEHHFSHFAKCMVRRQWSCKLQCLYILFTAHQR